MPWVESLWFYLWKRGKSQRKIQSYSNSIVGVNLIGYVNAIKGIGEAARSTALALGTRNIPVELIDFNKKSDKIFGQNPYRKTQNFPYKINIYHLNPPQLPYVWFRYPKSNLINNYAIGVWYWELSELPKSWCQAFFVLDEIWVASEFVLESVSKYSPIPVIKIPPCVNVNYNEGLTRRDFHLPENAFLFLCAYDFFSTSDRKNPQAALRSFKMAFHKNDPSVGLVVKVNNSWVTPKDLKTLHEEIKDYKNIYLIDESYDKITFNSLVNLVDVYVSLHRAEGFGLIPAEAMFLGKPVIMTNWSGNTDFMNDENSCGVNYKFISIEGNVGPYKNGQLWADPDVNHAAEYMIKLKNNLEYRELISKNAPKAINEYYSPDVVGKKIEERLKKLLF